MRRYDIITLILSIIDFALAAPILAQEKHQARNDWEHILEGVWGEEDTVWGRGKCTTTTTGRTLIRRRAQRRWGPTMDRRTSYGIHHRLRRRRNQRGRDLKYGARAQA